MYPIVRVDSRRAEALEPLGTKRKFWYRDGERRMLFKAEERGTGDDWAEKIACELCALLGLPHVHYELAIDVQGDVPGVVCETCAPPPTVLGLGNQLLLVLDRAYLLSQGRKYRVREHTVVAVTQVIELLRPPPPPWNQDLPSDIDSALGVFAGYVMLDVWIANQDRHHENWGALLVEDALHLAPTFDHGSSMARNLTDHDRQERLTTRDANRRIETFIRRARSAFYADAVATKPMMTIDAWHAFAQQTAEAATIWLEILTKIDSAAVERVLSEVPPQRMSDICKQFTGQLLLANRQRLLMGDKA